MRYTLLKVTEFCNLPVAHKVNFESEDITEVKLKKLELIEESEEPCKVYVIVL